MFTVCIVFFYYIPLISPTSRAINNKTAMEFITLYLLNAKELVGEKGAKLRNVLFST